jgi:hypothetical protein
VQKPDPHSLLFAQVVPLSFSGVMSIGGVMSGGNAMSTCAEDMSVVAFGVGIGVGACALCPFW